MNRTNRMSTETMVLGAILTALVVVLQLLGSFIRFGPFSVSLVLIPIVIGAATCGTAVGAWLGGVFGIAVLLSGDAAAFLAVNVFGTIVTVMLKGILCGLAAGLFYKALQNANRYLAVVASAVICPIVNTGVFLLGGWVFFIDTLKAWGISAAEEAAKSGETGIALQFDNIWIYLFCGMVGLNFIFELATNVILSPVCVRLINIKNK